MSRPIPLALLAIAGAAALIVMLTAERCADGSPGFRLGNILLVGCAAEPPQ